MCSPSLSLTESMHIHNVEIPGHVKCHSDGTYWCLLWLKPDAVTLFMLCNAESVEIFVLKPCCVVMCGMLEVK